jgi:hypothetical protein
MALACMKSDNRMLINLAFGINEGWEFLSHRATFLIVSLDAFPESEVQPMAVQVTK